MSGSRPAHELLLVILMSLIMPLSKSSIAEVKVPPEARQAALGFLNYAVERDATEVGFFESKFGVALSRSSDNAVAIGEPLPSFMLKRDGLRRFAEDPNSDLLTFAEPRGFVFPVIVQGRVVGAISSIQLDSKWVWDELFAQGNTLVVAIRDHQSAAPKKDERKLAYLHARSFGFFVLQTEDDGIAGMVSMTGWVSESIAPPTSTAARRGFVDYGIVGPGLREAARKQFAEVK